MVAVDGDIAHQEDAGPERPPQGMWAATKRFLTKGNARWSALVGVALLVGTVYVVSENPGTVEQLRQQLLLKNGKGAGQTQERRTDPEVGAGDKLMRVKCIYLPQRD